MILDTNAYSSLVRGVKSVIDIVNNTHELKLPLPVIAELRFGFAKGARREYNENTLQKFLSQPQISFKFPTIQTTIYYAELQLICQQKGKALSQNDIWIAALIKESDETLITFDKNFEVFSEVFRDKLRIL